MQPASAPGTAATPRTLEKQGKEFAIRRLQALERGRQARSLKKLGPPFTAQQRRMLEDALSAAVNAAMGLEASDGRLGYIARYLAAQDDGREPPAAPPRQGKLSSEQSEELKELIGAVHRSVNAANCRLGSPLRNVAEHLLSQHRVWKAPQATPQTAEERSRAIRQFAMLGAAPKSVSMKFVLPAAPTAAQAAAHEAAVAREDANDPLVLEALRAAKVAFGKYDADRSGAHAASNRPRACLSSPPLEPSSRALLEPSSSPPLEPSSSPPRG